MFVQSDRLIRIDSSPLPPDELLVESVSGWEGFSDLFDFKLILVSENLNIDASQIVGQKITFSVKTEVSQRRNFNGYVIEFTRGEVMSQKLRVYRARIAPWFWFLNKTRDCRIFQECTVLDIIEQVFGDFDVADFDTANILTSYATREYCVQYNETDHAFVSRLLEEEGIFYWFAHSAEGHTMMLSDSMSGCAACELNPIPFSSGSQSLDHVSSWSHNCEFRTGAWAQTDYNFAKPKASLGTDETTIVPVDLAKGYEDFSFPGAYYDKEHGQHLTRVRMEAEEWPFDVVTAETTSRRLAVSNKFQLCEHAADSENGTDFVVIDMRHAVSNRSVIPGVDASEIYEAGFRCIPASTMYRPPQTTRKARVPGIQTAVVTGISGQEIYTDKYARIKVQFFWDRYGQNNEKSSCWVRVAQSNASGGKWGQVAIPRMGQEVLIAFVEGDPDRPICIGTVYNDANMPPYDLPGSKNLTGFKSNSTLGGGGYNEYVFDDTKGNELIREHGQFDKDSTIENDLREHVLHDRSRDVTNDETIQIGNNQTSTVGVDQSLTVGNNQTVAIGTNQTTTIGANQSIQIGANLTEIVSVNYAETVGAAMALTIGAAFAETVGAAKQQTIAADKSVTVGQNMSESVGKDLQVSVGDNATESVGKDKSDKVGKKYLLDAGDEITIKTGKASINMKKNGDITIQGKKITMKGSGDVIIKGKKVLEN